MHELSPNPVGFPMVFQCLGLGPKAYWAIQRWWHQQLVDGNGRDFYPNLCSEYPFSCLNKNLVIKWPSAPWELRWNLVQPRGISFWFSFFLFLTLVNFVGGWSGMVWCHNSIHQKEVHPFTKKSHVFHWGFSYVQHHQPDHHPLRPLSEDVFPAGYAPSRRSPVVKL